MVDIHIARAARDLDKPPSQVTKEERNQGKIANLKGLRLGLQESLTKVYQIVSSDAIPTDADGEEIELLLVRITQWLHGPCR